MEEKQKVTFEDLLARDGRLIYKTKGVSMEPMLRQNRDLVQIEPPAGRLRRFDVALYRRGERDVLHRVIRVKDGYYLIRGDNTFALERVPDAAVIGVLKGFQRKGKMHTVTERGYRCYVSVWNAIYPLRALWSYGVRLLKRIARKTGLTPVLKKLLKRK